jgi:hypothetical protein
LSQKPGGKTPHKNKPTRKENIWQSKFYEIAEVAASAPLRHVPTAHRLPVMHAEAKLESMTRNIMSREMREAVVLARAILYQLLS